MSNEGRGRRGSKPGDAQKHGRNGRPADKRRGTKPSTTRPIDRRRQQKPKPEPPEYAFGLYPLDGIEGRGMR